MIVTATTAACLFVFFLIQSESIKSFVDAEDTHLLQRIGSSQLLMGVAVAAVLLGHVALVVWLGLVASHKVAGPLYRFKKVMKEVADGDMSVRMKLRKGDQLDDVAEAFNEMMDALERRGGGTPED